MTASTMTKKTARKAKSVSKAALGRYLAAGLGATGLATAESEAAIVTLNVAAIGESGNGSGLPVDISGVNAGIEPAGPGLYKLVYNLGSIPVSPYSVFAVGNTYPSSAGDLTGLVDFSSVRFANGGSRSTPKIFTEGQFVDSSASNNWESIYNAAFKTVPTVGSPSTAPSITGPGKYMGFRVGTPSGPFNYGYFEVTWDSTTEQFQILSGAYESTPNTPIAVPEPATMALTGIAALALGAGAIRRSRKARKAVAEGTLAEAV